MIKTAQLFAMKTKRYETFDELKENHNKVLTVHFCNDKRRWIQESTCTCGNFQRNFICKHLLGLAKKMP